jgi:general secretion pathway protein M
MIAALREKIWLRRAVFVGANLAVAALAIGALVMPIWDAFAARDNRIMEQRALLARLEGIAAQEPRIRAIARETEAQVNTGEFLRGANEGVISADQQTRLKAMAESAGARLRSVQSLPAKTSDQIRYTGVRMDLSGPIQAIQRALHAVENGKPYLFVAAASIKVSPLASQSGTAQEPVIEAQFDVYGAVQPEGGER